jgi:tetratricopeptide (TPR) repeat protein
VEVFLPELNLFGFLDSARVPRSPEAIQTIEGWIQVSPPRMVWRTNWVLLRPLLSVGVVFLGIAGINLWRFRHHQREMMWANCERHYQSGEHVQAVRTLLNFVSDFPSDARITPCLRQWLKERKLPLAEARWVHIELLRVVYRGDPYGRLSEELVKSAAEICDEMSPVEADLFWEQTANLCLPELPQRRLDTREVRLALGKGHKIARQFDESARNYIRAIDLGELGVEPVLGLLDLDQTAARPLSDAVEADGCAVLLSLDPANSRPSPRKLLLRDLLLRRLRQGVEPAWRGLVELSRRELAEGRWQQAAELANAAWEVGPAEHDVWEQTLQVLAAEANSRRLNGDLEGANQVVVRALDAARKSGVDAPDDPRFPLFQGLLLLQGSDVTAAEEPLREAERRAWREVHNLELKRGERQRFSRLQLESQVGLATCLVMQLREADPGRAATIGYELDSLQAQFDKPQLFEFSRVLAGQRLMLAREWRTAASEMDVIAKTTDLPSVRRMAHLSQAECLRQLEDWRTLHKVAGEMTMEDPGWNRGWELLAEACRALRLWDELPGIERRRMVWDPISVIGPKIDEQLARPVAKRKWGLIEADLARLTSQLGPTWPGLGRERARVMVSQKKWTEAAFVLQANELVRPRDESLLWLRLVLELHRDDQPAPIRIRRAVSALERFRLAREELLFDPSPERLDPAPFRPILEGRFPTQPLPGLAIVRSLLHELAGSDPQTVQRLFAEGLEEAETKVLAGQKVLEYALRLETTPQVLSDFNLGLLTGLISRLPGAEARCRAITLWQHWDQRGTLPDDERQRFAETLLTHGAPFEAVAQYRALIQTAGPLRNQRRLEFLFFVLEFPTHRSHPELEREVERVLQEMEAVQSDLPETVLARARQELRLGAESQAVRRVQTLPGLGADRRPTELLRSFAFLGRADTFLDRLGAGHPANSRQNREALREWLAGAPGSEQSRGLDQLLAGGRQQAARQAELYSIAASDLQRWKRIDEADQLLARAIQETGDLHLVLQRGLLLGQSGQLTEALLFLRAVDERIPGPAAEAYRSLVDRNGNDLSFVASVRGRLEELTGGEPCPAARAPLLQLLVGLQSRPETLSEALLNHERLLTLRRESPLLLNNLAVLEAFVPERVQSGLRHVQQAIELDRPRVEYLDTLALLQLQSDDLQAGLTTLLSQAPLLVRPEHRLHLGLALLRSGRIEQAAEIERELRRLLSAGVPWSPLNAVLWEELCAGPAGQARRNSPKGTLTPSGANSPAADLSQFVPPAPSEDDEPEESTLVTPEREPAATATIRGRHGEF